MSDQRSIIVSGIPSSATRDQLEIHFQKRRNGGGDVASLIYPLNETSVSDCAVITFERHEVAKMVLATPQKFNGVHLGTRPLAPQVYQRITAEISRKLVDGMEGARHALQWQYGLTCLESESDGQKCYTVRGSWFQIDAARLYLERRSGFGESRLQPSRPIEGAGAPEDISAKIWKHMASGGGGSSRASPFYPPSDSTESTLLSGFGDRSHSKGIGVSELEAAAYAPGKMEGPDSHYEFSGSKERDGERRDHDMSTAVAMAMMMEDDVEESDTDMPSLQVDADVYNYLKQTHDVHLKTIRDECKVDLVSDDGQTIASVRIVPSTDDTTPTQISKAKRKFVTLYENTFRTIQKYDLHPPERLTDPEKLENAALDTQVNVPDVYVKQEEGGNFAIYGTSTSIGVAKTHFYNKLAESLHPARDRGRSPRGWEADLSDKIRDIEPLTDEEKPKPKEELFASLLSKIREGGPKDSDPETAEDGTEKTKTEDEKDGTADVKPQDDKGVLTADVKTDDDKGVLKGGVKSGDDKGVPSPTKSSPSSSDDDTSDSEGDDITDHHREETLKNAESSKDEDREEDPTTTERNAP
ncbi:uncharacterized protein [Ptychodera flava]|uniref:uncharacterized protein n=1 Tax=Ptychodera flava TaxID=63121 RepID=UPI00396AB012